jgi:ATP dependent DNA ligase domain
MHKYGTVAEKGGTTMPVFAHKQYVLLFLLSLSACVPARVAQPIQMKQTADSSIMCDQMAIEYKTNTEIAAAKIAKNKSDDTREFWLGILISVPFFRASAFPRITQGFEQLQPDTLIDGEIVAIDDSGRPSFNLLQHHRSKASAIQFYAFDILIDRGRSLLEVPLKSRRELLNEALHAVSDPIRLSEAFGKENNAYPGYPKRPKRKRRCGKQLHQEIHVRATMAESDK